MAGGAPANYVARWDGNAWFPLGNGLDSQAWSLAIFGTDLYVGGYFLHYINKWDGGAWVGSYPLVLNGPVFTLKACGTNLYVGGAFTSAPGAVGADKVAKWNGSSWSGLGAGLNDWVWALAGCDNELYVGGYFTKAGGITGADYVAKWNGSSWSALGSGIGSRVFSLAVADSSLYVGMAGSSPANFIAKWNGNSWSGLGSGVNKTTFGLAVSGNDLYAGGYFTTAGGKISAHIARAYLPALPGLSIHPHGTEFTVFWPSANTVGFALEQANTLAAPVNWLTNTSTITDDGTNKSISIPATNASQFFRLHRP
jgi:hypothetical protein